MDQPTGSATVTEVTRALAGQIVDSDTPLLAQPNEQFRLELAWALRDLCFSAWSSNPQRGAKAADRLNTLAQRDPVVRVDARREDLTAIASEIEALAHWSNGLAHVIRGQTASAVTCFDRAAQTFRKLGFELHAAQTQVAKIMALSMLGEFDQAVDCASAAEAEFLALGDLHAAAKVNLNLGALNEARGAYAKASHHSRLAAVYFARVGDVEHSIMADINMANALTSLGDFDEARRIYARARRRARTHDFPVLEALVAEAVAIVQLVQGRYADALAGLESARRRYEQMDMPQQMAIAEKQLADVYLELRLLPEAARLFDRALARFAELDVPDEQAWAFVQNGRTQALLGFGERAGESFAAAAVLFSQQDNGAGIAAVTLARAELALANRNFSLAYAEADAAAQAFATAELPERHLRAHVIKAYALLESGSGALARTEFASIQAQASKLALLSIQMRCRIGKGLAALALGDVADAKSAFSEAVDDFEDQRRVLPGDEFRSAFLTDHLRPYQELVRLALQAHEQSSSRESATELLLRLDRFRASTLVERLAQGSAVQSKLSAPIQALRERLNWLYRRVQSLSYEGEHSVAFTAEIRRTELELMEHVRRERLQRSAPTDVVSAAGERNYVDALLDFLGEQDAMIEYGVLDDELFACVLTRAGVQVYRHIAAWSQVTESLRGAKFQMDALSHGALPMQQHLPTLTLRVRRRMAQLYDLVFAPMASAFSGSRRLLIVPHAQLSLLPFAALYDGEAFIGQRFELATVPSARLALRCLSRSYQSPSRAFVLADSSRLPHAALEAQLVAALLPEARVFVDSEATLQAVQDHAALADVVHLACHAEFRADNPLFSALHLHDSVLTAESAERLQLQPGIVVLSACETGLVELSNGDEMVGLVRAFLVAGAMRVLASLWRVDDAVTAQFMVVFYGAMCRGAAPAAALQMAQGEVMRTHPHPFYWAAFALQGGW